jgi:ring-1,2-phenylacetyl-CoA epoxidase subunit PaaE
MAIAYGNSGARDQPAAPARSRRRAAPPSVEAPPRARATLIGEGVTSEIPTGAAETIIDAAIRAGRNPPYSGCGGMRCTFRARLVKGRVAMNANYTLEPWKLAAGFVLTLPIASADRAPADRT